MGDRRQPSPDEIRHREIARDMAAHVREMHALDERIRAALFGELVEGVGPEGPTLARDEGTGLVAQVSELYEKQANGGLRARLATRERVAIGLVVLVVEVASKVLG